MYNLYICIGDCECVGVYYIGCCNTIFYCGRKDKYSGDIKEIKEIEKIGKRIDIILENGNKLPIYDIEENSLS